MGLLNKYQNRGFQFSLTLLALLSREGTAPEKTVRELAGRFCLDYAGQVLEPLCKNGILKKEGAGYSLGADFKWRPAAPGGDELLFLRRILGMEEARLFLPEELLERLKETVGTDVPDSVVELYAPTAPATGEGIAPEDFRNLLSAIAERRDISYRFRTKDRAEYQETTAFPWKAEFSVFDRRWWVILYSTAEGRTIKARLENLKDIRPLKCSAVKQEDVDEAVESKLEKEPIVLRVRNDHGGLERCFLAFENQLFEKTALEPDGTCTVTFRYYDFDYSEILHRLLYLGPDVTLLGPGQAVEDLKALIDEALD